jgi:FAD synthase
MAGNPIDKGRMLWIGKSTVPLTSVRMSDLATYLAAAVDADALAAAGVTRVFSEKISTRATRRPERDKAIALAQEMRGTGIAVTMMVHEHKRLGRGIELATLAEQLKASGIGREFLTGELQGG